MSLSLFHPVVREWFQSALGEPTAAQTRGWEAIRQGSHTLIAAPTGSGKTLAAFLAALDDLFQEGLERPLPDEVRVVYVSPLKALSADIHKNLAEPRLGIRKLAEAAGLEASRITAAVRTGDTAQSERAAMLRTPPHILVTTPESLYLLLTAERSREMLRTVRTVIIDEIHALIGTRRGAHLALSLERLENVAGRSLHRVGLSATQRPIGEVARYLAGCRPATPQAGAPARPLPFGPGTRRLETAVAVTPASDRDDVSIIDEGHRRAMDLVLEVPRSPLDAVMSHEVWNEYYDRLTALIASHRTTLVFVNTRKMAERIARHLSERVGEGSVTAHHGSLSKENRLDAETRLKEGRLRALVATASLELGIDIGHVDLVCQIGSPHRIATFLQRVGRSGHSVAGTPKGRLFPASLDDLVECAALLRAVERGELDRIVAHDAPLDVLAQQIVAETACDDYGEDELFELVRRAWPYRDLERREFDAVVTMVSEGYATKRGRRGALVHRDEVNLRVRGRRSARLLAITSGGAIPEVADYRVLLEPDDTFIGTINEDFAIESNAGDIFQLGNMSWQVLQVGSGTVRVADARGAPPTIPFWTGEAPARSDELSAAVSDLRADVEWMLAAAGRDCAICGEGVCEECVEKVALSFRPGEASEGRSAAGNPPQSPGGGVAGDCSASKPALSEVEGRLGMTGRPGAVTPLRELVAYLAAGRRALGALPTQNRLVLERFFDESGGMQLVLHSPFGSRINKAWGLALRKRFCRQFNFELQAAATEDAILLSLGPQHSFPLADVFRYLHPGTARDILVQAFLDAPVFQTRWRWNATISLAIPRNRGGRKVAPQLQRAMADDLMAAVFPDAAACFENIRGDRELPDHPLVNQSVRDCLEEAMDFDGLARLLTRIHAGEIELVARDTPEPSVLSHEILNARPYAFLDDAPLEERRTQAVVTRRAGDFSSSRDLGALDLAAIERVRDEERPDPRDADELHDALLTLGCLTAADAARIARPLFEELTASRRATLLTAGAASLWVAAERLPELLAIHPVATCDPRITPPASRNATVWTAEEALAEIVKGRLSVAGPVTADALAGSLGVETAAVEQALIALEATGVVLRGRFTPWSEWRDRAAGPQAGAADRQSLRSERDPDHAPCGPAVQRARGLTEWCDRRLLARIHRYTLSRLRAEIEPVTAADFTRFLFRWQHAAPASRATGIEGLRVVLGVLDAYEAGAAAWERSILPARLDRYDPSLLDLLCLTGEAGWARLSAESAGERGALISSSPIALLRRENLSRWRVLRAAGGEREAPRHSETALAIVELLGTRGALFTREIADACGVAEEAVARALADLVASGVVTSDGFAGLRLMLRPPSDRSRTSSDLAGRWSLVGSPGRQTTWEEAVEAFAWTLLRRYGVVFRRLIVRETNAPPWRDLARVYRRLEARGDIRGGRFVAGMPGEQFALPEAVERLREVRREAPDGAVVVISAADPLNLTGVLTAGERVRAVAGTRIAYRDGIPLSVMEGDYLRPLTETDPGAALDAAAALAGRKVTVSSGFVGRHHP